ncbi:MAG: glycosyltransferase family 2 protein [Synergistaceae bacterium]|nr:glycosyltransferase family 2 protein [Synergistaceae bacterium]
MPEVDILMATYNGEKYITEQIESILAQTFQDFRLLIRDDGSSDNTPAIIEEYASRYPEKIEIVHDNVICRNPEKNFFQLLTYAQADYAMFCDQDDYWLPYKIQISLDFVKKAERENPGKAVCAFTGLARVDENLNSMDTLVALDLKKKQYNNLTNLILRSCVWGCTEIFNRKLYTSIGEYSESMIFHDHWLPEYACACGVLCHIPMALILHRIHGNNVSVPLRKELGFKERMLLRFNRILTFLARPIESLTVSRKKFLIEQMRWRDCYLLFRARYSHNMSRDKRNELDNVIAMYGGGGGGDN